MNRFTIYTAFILCFFTGLIQAQTYKLSDKQDEFIKDLSTIMTGTKNEEAMAVAKDFETVWTSNLNDAQRGKLVTLVRQMAGKKYKAMPHFRLLMQTVNYAVMKEHFSETELSKMLNVADKVVNQYDSKQTTRFLETTKSFFEKKALYSSNFNRLYAMGGTYTFEFKGEEAVKVEEPPKEEPEPVTPEPGKDGKGADKKGKGAKKDDGWFDSWDQAPATDGGSDATASPTSNQTIEEAIYVKQIQPTISGAVIVFDNINLTFATAHDSVSLLNTKGSLLLKDGIFVGTGGKFDWTMAGMPDVYCEFKQYNFDTKNPKLTSDDVTLTYPNKLSAPVAGVFEFVSKKHNGPANAQFPRFMSLNSNITIKDLGTNLIYKGGFSLIGRRSLSTSLSNKPCTLNYVVDGETKFKTQGRQYEFLDSIITSPQVSITIPLKRDSLFHPAVKFTYNKKIPMLRLNKNEGGYQNTPYINTFHKVDINIDGLHWDLNTSEINMYILNAKTEVPAVFESHDFYDSTRYSSLKGLYNFHPLQVLMAYSKSVKSFTFYANDLASAYKLNPGLVKGAMVEMMQQGFVDYTPETGLIKMNRKGDHNVYASNKKKDYDSFRMESFSRNQPNATLDLNSNVLTVRGIEKFPLSEKLQVYVIPRQHEIQLLKDRNFLLEGEVAAGNFRFKGSGFSFLYDEFTVEMNQIDTILFTPQEARGKADSVQLGSEIRYSAGTLYVNKPDNKAGLKDYPEYPRLNVQSGAAIYFDQKARQKGTYNRNVRFEIPTVNVDSLNAKDPQYRGVFYSDGIFPEFEEDLTPMSDNTLGFRHTPKKPAYPLFSDKGKITFSSDIVMDMKGLRAAGQIDYLSTTLTSKDILFTPDSVVTKGPAAEIKEAVIGEGIFPRVKVKEFKLSWLAKVDSMQISNIGSPFEIYKETGASFNGTVIVRRNGLFGAGLFDRKDSEINSLAFKFEKDKFTAGDAEFRIKSKSITKPALLANFVNIDFNMARGIADIKTSDNPQLVGFASLEFPYAEYKTSINKATWLLDKKLVLMEGDVATTTFTSTNPAQENLSFHAKLAGYNIDKMTLSISGIPYIQSADARIIPSKGVVMITENAAMQPLKKAELLMDTVTAYHKMFDGDIQILSRSKFMGNATYKYTNFEGKEFSVKMGDFETRSEEAEKKRQQPKTYTAAQGVISEEDKFFVTSRILFKGNITMHSYRKFLELNGFIKLDLKSTSSLGTWMPYKSSVEDDNVVISVNENLNDGGVQLVTGLHVDKTTSSIYTTFLSPKTNPDDQDILRSVGLLSYNPAANEFKITSPERAKQNTYEGNQYILDDANGKVRMEGKLKLFDYPEKEYTESSGFVEVDLDSNRYNLNTLLALNFPAPMQVMDAIAESIMLAKEESGIGLREANPDKEALYSKLGQLIGEGAAKNYKSKSGGGHLPLTEAGRKLQTMMVLSNVKMKWSEENKAMYSVGPIGLSNIGNKDINSELSGMVEIRKVQGGDQMTVYIEATADKWYFLDFSQNRLSILSSDENVNSVIASRTKAGKAGQFSSAVATADERSAFKEKYEKSYLGGINKPVAAKKKEETKEEKKEVPTEEKKDGF
jgi:hypothetical protein